MTISLFSQLVRDIKSELGPTGIQRRLLDVPAASLNMAQKAGLTLFWSDTVARASTRTAAIDPTTVSAVMACMPEVLDLSDDFFFI